MKLVLMTLTAALMIAAPAVAQDPAKVESESQGIFTSIIRIVTKWVFPICAAYCFLYGIIGKGVKRGEWDMAAICTIAAIALALFPKLLTALFGVPL